jgi:hypothetical protein
MKREENFSRMSKEDLSVTFLKKYCLAPLFSECERKIAHNLDIILNNELHQDLWDFFTFYDRILELRKMLEGRLDLINPVEVSRVKMKEFFVKDKKNFNKALRIMEKLADGESKVHFKSMMNVETPRFRNPGEGNERIKPVDPESYLTSYQKKRNTQKQMLGYLKEKLRGSIKAKQLGAVLLFEQLEANFPLKDYKILLKAEKHAVIWRMLSLMDRVVKSGLVSNKKMMEKQDIQMENKLYYDLRDDDSDDELGGFSGMFSMMNRRRRKKNVTLMALKERRYQSVIDHSMVANLMDKLNSVGYDQLEFFTMIFQKNGILRHRKTMKKVLENMVQSIKISGFKFEYMRDIHDIFENKIGIVQSKLDELKTKYKTIYNKLDEYKNKNNRMRAKTILKKYKTKFVRLTSFLRIIVSHKVSLFKEVFENFYEKKFKNTNEKASTHVKMCLQREDLTGILVCSSSNLKTM